MKDTESKREREKKTVEMMIGLYCKKNHGSLKGDLCEECGRLRDYAFERTDQCPFMESKTFCTNCQVHCYRKDMRERIRTVMRYSGPRMVLYHPVVAFRHLMETKRERKGLESGKERILQNVFTTPVKIDRPSGIDL